MRKIVKVSLIASTLGLLGGCAVVPYDARPYGQYDARPYGQYRYYEPATVYYPQPIYVGPSFGLTIEGGGHRHHRRHRRH